MRCSVSSLQFRLRVGDQREKSRRPSCIIAGPSPRSLKMRPSGPSGSVGTSLYIGSRAEKVIPLGACADVGGTVCAQPTPAY
jgi:hypothetical protein